MCPRQIHLFWNYMTFLQCVLFRRFFPLFRSWTLGGGVPGAVWGEVVAGGPWRQGEWMVRAGDVLKLCRWYVAYGNDCCLRAEKHRKTNNRTSEHLENVLDVLLSECAQWISLFCIFIFQNLPSSVWQCWASPELILQKSVSRLCWQWEQLYKILALACSGIWLHNAKHSLQPPWMFPAHLSTRNQNCFSGLNLCAVYFLNDLVFHLTGRRSIRLEMSWDRPPMSSSQRLTTPSYKTQRWALCLRRSWIISCHVPFLFTHLSPYPFSSSLAFC